MPPPAVKITSELSRGLPSDHMSPRKLCCSPSGSAMLCESDNGVPHPFCSGVYAAISACQGLSGDVGVMVHDEWRWVDGKRVR